MKKLSILAAALAIGGVSLNAAAMNPFLNTYIGAGVSMQNITGDEGYSRNFVPEVFLGYGAMVNETFFFGGELAYAYASNLNKVTKVTDASLATSRSFKLSILPGMLLRPGILGFIRIGAANTRFTAFPTNKWGFILGPGVEIEMDPAISLRAEYNYTEYRPFTVAGTPKSDEFVISVKYTFDY